MLSHLRGKRKNVVEDDGERRKSEDFVVKWRAGCKQKDNQVIRILLKWERSLVRSQ